MSFDLVNTASSLVSVLELNKSMRAREFLKELKLDIPDQMVTVQVPLSTIKNGGIDLGDAGDVNNPGRRFDSKGDSKWSPPLQQHLDAVKDSVGPSDQSVSLDPDTEDEAQQHSPHDISADPQVQEPTPQRIATLARLPGVLG